jgi:DNA processing protein
VEPEPSPADLPPTDPTVRSVVPRLPDASPSTDPGPPPSEPELLPDDLPPAPPASPSVAPEPLPNDVSTPAAPEPSLVELASSADPGPPPVEPLPDEVPLVADPGPLVAPEPLPEDVPLPTDPGPTADVSEDVVISAGRSPVTLTDSAGALPEVAWLVALSALPGMGPARMDELLADRSADEGWAAVRAGVVPAGVPEATTERWRCLAAGTDVAALWSAHEAAGVRVLLPGEPGWPAPLDDDPEPPLLLSAKGDPTVLDRPRVAVIGTRRCSYAGREVARQLGRELAEAGVCVVSGLALGIDGAAHGGALGGSAPPVGVVATGLDVVYPRRHAELWRSVGEVGLLLSEYPLGVWPERWRFPARNRIIAALADVVVVVESHDRGGSMHTVESAMERDRPVMAVPGSVRSPASAGTNALLAAGCPPVRDATDVLVALGMEPGVWDRSSPPLPDGDAGTVFEAIGWEPCTLEQLADRLGVPLGPVAVHLVDLERDGWVHQHAGWYERCR